MLDVGAAPLVAAALALVWVIVNPRSPDLAAQVYRVEPFGHVGFAFYNNWYAGHHLPGYSVVFRALASRAGLRAPRGRRLRAAGRAPGRLPLRALTRSIHKPWRRRAIVDSPR